MITSVITGDIINSRKLTSQAKWQTPLKELLNRYGKSPKTWEIYRGDSFQVEITEPEDALLTALHIKTIVRTIGEIDVRMGIGIGEKDFSAPKITHSNGEVFINAGESFESLLKEKTTLAIKSPWKNFDREMNLLFKLAAIIMDRWSHGAAEYIAVSLENRELNQKEIGNMLDIAQSSVSSRHRSAHLSEILEMDEHYREKVKNLMSA